MKVSFIRLHVKITDINFDNKILKRPGECKRLSAKRLLNEFSNMPKKNSKKVTLNDFLQG